jgi:hypothetical protein
MLFPTVIYLFSTIISGVCGAAIASISAPAPSKWIHPGAMISQSQLDFIKEKVNSKEQPWLDAYNALLEDVKVAVSPSPHIMVECGSYSNPDVGCKVERNDSISAYGNALAWAISGETQYAQQAIKIMDAYASTIKGHNNSNAPLQSGWVGSIWARTGELIRYTDAGWQDDSIDQFASMLRNVYMPLTVGGTDHNVANWELGISSHVTKRDCICTHTITASYDRSCNPHVSLP